ncbi:hypothetical protein GFS24_25825 [Chitinophaga sp. SYP-B3965]|uniref:hypothetical protein n=1 Tax=Chitinophaga sp. SYP-B3965 TaxID=2663120 RepID=UPI0012995D02|nr:hypothetical protein [Chitinophaga sp. SYP-B3965]MRG48562.1 hypothetical protein [Chitinophaga sp. SYP-B3965]
MEKLMKEVRFLKIYSLGMTGVLALFILMSFTKNTRFEEIDVERINIVEKNGQLKMVISNKEKQHPGMLKNKPFPARTREAGLIFFNSAGDECGGLTYEGDSVNGSGMVVSFDQYENDQVMQMQYMEDVEKGGRKRSYGMKLWDRSEQMPLDRLIKIFDSLGALNNKSVMDAEVNRLKAAKLMGRERMFVGKTKGEEVGVFIRDDSGNPRIKLYLDKNNQAKMEFLDEKGNLIPIK